MKIVKIEINNYKSLKESKLYPKNIFSLVGKNNSGKSNVMHAINLFFDFKSSNINSECFFYKKPEKNPIIIKIKFNEFTEK